MNYLITNNMTIEEMEEEITSVINQAYKKIVDMSEENKELKEKLISLENEIKFLKRNLNPNLQYV